MAVRGGRARLRIERAIDATIFVLKNIPTLLRLGLFPTLIALAISFCVVIAVPAQVIDRSKPGETTRVMESLWLVSWTPSILFALAGAIFMVGIHRFILRGEKPGWVIARFGRYELALIGAIALVCAMLYAVTYVFAAPMELIELIETSPSQVLLSNAIALIVVVILVWLYARLLLLTPHAAVTGHISPMVSWRAMAGNVWSAVIAWVVLGLGEIVVALIPGLLGLLFMKFLLPVSDLGIADSRGMLLLELYETTAKLPAYGAVIAVNAAFLSYAYKDLVEEATPSA